MCRTGPPARWRCKSWRRWRRSATPRSWASSARCAAPLRCRRSCRPTGIRMRGRLADRPPDVTAIVSAGLRYAEVAERLHRAGFALPNLASLPHISIAGACATGTHGSGNANGGLATSVSALGLVGPDGDVTELSRRDDPERFPGAVVNLGALGVVTSLTLELVPGFEVAQYVYLGLALDRLPEGFEAVLAAAYS